MHPLFKRIAAESDHKLLKEAHAEAMIDWIKKVASQKPIAQAILDEAALRNPEVKAAMKLRQVSVGPRVIR